MEQVSWRGPYFGINVEDKPIPFNGLKFVKTIVAVLKAKANKTRHTLKVPCGEFSFIAT